MYGLSSHLNHHSFFLKLNACHKSDNHWLADVSLNNEEDFYDDAEKNGARRVMVDGEEFDPG